MKTSPAANDKQASSGRRDGLACLCGGVSFAELEEAISEDHAATVESLGEALGCGVQCGSCLPALREALGQVAWFPASASARAITRSGDRQGQQRLIYRVDIALAGAEPYPKVMPGQHVVLRADTEAGAVERTYTVVAQDLEARRLTVAIRRKPEGRLTPWLLQAADGGGPRNIEVSAPGGPGLHSSGTKSVVFFAGGVGVTPAVAMVNALAPMAKMHLDYSVRDADDAAFVPKFDARRADRSNFTYALRETALKGPITLRDVREVEAKHRGSKFFICGPDGYVERVRRGLRKAGVESARIHVELFALSAARAPARSFRFKAYAAGALLAAAPLLMLLPRAEELRPHGHPNVGHAELKCVACHVASPASTRQALQAKAKLALGLRQTGAVLGMEPVGSATCIQCHANPDDQHAASRFLEPRFDQARAETGAQMCVSCHREHQAVRVTAPVSSYCVSCHQDLKVKDDKASPTHDFLLANKRWDTCMQCHDYHGNHRWNTPLRLADAVTIEKLNQYFLGGPSPYGATVIKAKKEPAS